MSIRVACVGGGPGGLLFSILLKRLRPDVEVVILERNQPTDAFGFGVVFSDRTLERIDNADPVLREALRRDGIHWNSIAVSLKGESFAFDGNGMAAVHRKILLRLLQEAAASAGVDLQYGRELEKLTDLDSFDVIVGADGTNSRVREQLEPALDSTVETAVAKFIWFGTTHIFDRLTFLHRRSEHGNFAVHAYPIGQGLSTFIVETDEETWRAAGLDSFDVTAPPGSSDQASQRYLENLFADDIAGGELVANNSRWGNFRTRRTGSWHRGNVALLGDAVHTAHFSVGSGTKMAMEDAIVLARELAGSFDDLEGAFARYEAERQPEVARIQDAAGPSLSWWENFGFYHEHLDPLDFAFHFFSRSIDIDRIARRDPALARRVIDAWEKKHAAAPLQSALRLGATDFGGRSLVLESVSGGYSLSDGEAVATSGVAYVDAPFDERTAAHTEAPGGADAVVVGGGTPVTRGIVSERIRIAHGLVAVILDDELSDAEATTLILSGRADAVARRGRDRDAI